MSTAAHLERDIFAVDYATSKLHRHQSRAFKLPLPIMGSKLGFQDQEAWTLVENEERSVGTCYVSTGIFASVQDSTPTTLQRNRIVIKVQF